MATNYYNAQIGVVDASGNVNVIYPITKAANVDLVATSYSTVEACLAALGTAAFRNASDTYTATGSTVATTKAVYDAYSTLNSNKQGCPNERVQYNSDILTYFPDAGRHLDSRYEGMLLLGSRVNLTAAKSCFLHYQIHAYYISGSDYTSLKINSYSYESFTQSDQTVHEGFIFISEGSLLKTSNCSGIGDMSTASYTSIYTCK